MLPWDNVTGSGTITSETHEVSGFDAIRAGGVAEVFVSLGDSWHVEVTTDDNLHEFLNIEVDAGTLNIRTREMVSVRPTNKLIVRVSMPSIRGVDVSGSTNTYIETTLEQDDFDIQTSGSSNVHLTVYVGRLTAALSGSSGIYLTGFAGLARFSGSGSSDIRGDEFSCNAAEVYLSGSSDARLTVHNRASGNLSGSSDLHLGGSPGEVNVRTSGSASVKMN